MIGRNTGCHTEESHLRHDYMGRQDIPVEAVMPAMAQQWAEYLVGGMIGLAVLWGIRKLLKEGDARLLICMLAGFIAIPMESHAMGMMKFVYPPVGQDVLITAFGRPIPVFMGFMYSAFYGVANYLYLNSTLSSRWSARTFWVGIASLFGAEALLEFVCLDLGLWAYFDDQPFVILGFPIHVAIVVACMCMTYGAFSRFWFDHVRGARQWLLLIVGPAILIASCTVYSFPLALGLDASGGLADARIGSVVSIVLGIALAHELVRAMSGGAARQTRKTA